MNWVFPSRPGTTRRSQSSDAELLAAIERARQDPTLDQEGTVSAKDMAKVARRYWAATENHFEVYIRYRMDDETKKRLRITAPRKIRVGASP
jgi:hypothetical protein